MLLCQGEQQPWCYRDHVLNSMVAGRSVCGITVAHQHTEQAAGRVLRSQSHLAQQDTMPRRTALAPAIWQEMQPWLPVTVATVPQFGPESRHRVKHSLHKPLPLSSARPFDNN